jgi:hypothetical protein
MEGGVVGLFCMVDLDIIFSNLNARKERNPEYSQENVRVLHRKLNHMVSECYGWLLIRSNYCFVGRT